MKYLYYCTMTYLTFERLNQYLHDSTFLEFYFRDSLIKSEDQILNVYYKEKYYAFSVQRLTIRSFTECDYQRYTHRHFFDNKSYRIVLYLKGKNAFYYDGKLKKCDENTILFLNPGRQVSIMPRTNSAYTVLEFYFDLVDVDNKELDITIFEYLNLLMGSQIKNKMMHALTNFEKTELKDHFIKIMNQLNINNDILNSPYNLDKEYKNYTKNQFTSNRLIYDMFIYLYDLLACSKTEQEKSLDSVIHYISCNYNKEISITFLAESINLSKNYFQSIFKSSYGITVITYINRLRVKKASQLLRNTDISISEIAEHVGVNSSYYFSKLFKSYTGYSPRDYRKEIISSSEL